MSREEVLGNKLIFMVDLDGVCCDWVSAGLRSLGKPELIGKWTPGAKSLKDITGLTYAEIWGVIDNLGSDWWRNLEEFSWFQELYALLCSKGKVVFCTSSSWESNSAKGKVEWLQDRLGKDFRDYIITNRKFYAAGEGRVLVDDNDKQCADFKSYGGDYIMFPQLWNATAFDEGAQKNKIEYVRKKIEEIQNDT